MATKEILIKALDCQCNECSHLWVTQESEMPESCPSCKSVDWNAVWQSSEASRGNTVQLSDFEKKQLEREMLRQSFIKQVNHRARRIISTKE